MVMEVFNSLFVVPVGGVVISRVLGDIVDISTRLSTTSQIRPTTITTAQPFSRPNLQLDTRPKTVKTMQITFVTDMDETYTVEIDPDMKLQDVQALLGRGEPLSVSRDSSLPSVLPRDAVRHPYIRAIHLARWARAQSTIIDDDGARCV
ncbi:hypothetical protein JVT61DRAFT_13270 [Boletus reticuloceps]|uniref:Uncharacterized protein n=1 Tax=Boletus reticuloceps TaxID=495285 RepID=A0A8I2YYS2_9AGAM|nr:hypothetical protein JVT61DRAFT_13270 [Boletus reticuloceps]